MTSAGARHQPQAAPMSAAIREHYDSLAFIYRTFWGDNIHHGLFLTGEETPLQAQLQMLDYCAARAGVQEGLRVLDVGCGHGGTCVYLAQKFGCHVVGLTVSEKQARLARETAVRAAVTELAGFVIGDADSYHFGHDCFDLIWTMESSEHFHDKPAYFRKAAAALRAGGHLLLAAWTGSMAEPQLREVARAFLCPSLQTGDAYAEQLAKAGMAVRCREDLTSKVTRTWEICQECARLAGPMVKLLPRAAREFVEGIPIILDAYRSAALSYTLLVAEK